MVYESYPWKQDLQRKKYLIQKHNTKERFDQRFDSTYTIFEKCIFYSAFIIRKLIDCGGKVSDAVDQYKLNTKTIKPIKNVNRNNRWPDEESHDWNNTKNVCVNGKDVCNWLIHSYLFFFEFDKYGIINGFYVSSDYDKNKVLYKILLKDWITYIDYIVSDDVVELMSTYDEKVEDYVYTMKRRCNE